MARTTGTDSARIVSLVLAAATICDGGACVALDDRTTVEDLRVLAISASPPEVFITDFDNPGVVPNVSIAALVIDPFGNGRPVGARVTACPYLVDAVTAATGGNAILCSDLPPEARREFAVTDFARGVEHTLTATVSFDETTSQVFAAAGSNDRIYGLTVMTEWEITSGTETVTALKRVRYTQPQMGWGQRPNQNPSLIGVSFFQEDVPGLTSAPEPTHFELLGTVGVLPQLSSTSVERSFVTPVATSATDPTPVAKTVARERIRLAYFATHGTFSPAVTSTDPSPIYEPGSRRDTTPSKYRMPGPGQNRPANGLVQLWIVARDERGGTSWISRFIQLPP
jgi:hypothetical protein